MNILARVRGRSIFTSGASFLRSRRNIVQWPATEKRVRSLGSCSKCFAPSVVLTVGCWKWRIRAAGARNIAISATDVCAVSSTDVQEISAPLNTTETPYPIDCDNIKNVLNTTVYTSP